MPTTVTIEPNNWTFNFEYKIKRVKLKVKKEHLAKNNENINIEEWIINIHIITHVKQMDWLKTQDLNIEWWSWNSNTDQSSETAKQSKQLTFYCYDWICLCRGATYDVMRVYDHYTSIYIDYKHDAQDIFCLWSGECGYFLTQQANWAQNLKSLWPAKLHGTVLSQYTTVRHHGYGSGAQNPKTETCDRFQTTVSLLANLE